MKASSILQLFRNRQLLILLIGVLMAGTGLHAQKKTVAIDGIIRHLDTVLPDIHVMNRTKNMGTTSSKDGTYKLPVSIGDSVLFSSVAYQNRTIVVSENHISKRRMDVYLEPGLNELEVIELQQKVRLEVQRIAVPRGAVLELDEMSSRTPNAELFTDPTSYVGVDFMNIFYGLTTKLRAKKREQRAKNRFILHLKREFPNKLKSDYGSGFFTDELALELEEIDHFLDFCEGNGLTDFYDKPEIEIKDFLIKQQKLYNSIKNEIRN